MHGHSSKDISKFFIAGINYKKTDAAIRGQFAISDEQYASLLALAPSYGLHELFILSTCNRTEIYGFAEHAGQLISLLCTQTEGGQDTFTQLAYIKKGTEAIEHLFAVGAGLDSQILGDYEIVGQLKAAVKFAKEQDFIGTYLDRLVNGVLQASKAVKNQTAISDGTVSVSFAAVQYIKQQFNNLTGKKILLLGIGKIGRSTCKNLVDYLDTTAITLINRTADKAAALAGELGLHHAPIEQLAGYIESSDIILVATNAAHPTILKSHLEGKTDKLIIDLSIPYNVEMAAQDLPNVHLVNVDELSKLKDETLQKREAEIPKARVIIDEHMAEFMDWFEMRKHVPVLKAVKTKLQEIQAFPPYLQGLSPVSATCTTDADAKIQRVINGMASKMRRVNQRGCYYIEAINEFIATGSN
ncbi:glutamyl-tRNA reductase [Pseudoflavitalea sp. X16]|uniref:glutamyl-tRNA reductase n=1 Tax=Paraflavitalea devenefica TaxID=2716334 RepID=UPI001420F35F|nr:glutamyl-tRNA reductase [Paraflavitalea devenefica]NII24063.1 glutamyl-tRNA reductase [Paraflavitalea devenefica]